MSLPNFHEVTIRDAEGFDKGRTVSITDGVSLIYCKKTGSEEWAEQSYKFDKKKFTPSQAKSWLEEKNIEYTLFENATKAAKKDGEEIDPENIHETTIEFIRKDIQKHIVSGIILVPDEVDADNEFANVEEIEGAMISYMEKYAAGMAGSTIAHTKHVSIGKDVFLIENYQTLKDMKMGDEIIKKGSWIQSYKVLSADIWEMIETGDIKGFSIGAELVKVPIEE